MSMLNVQIYIKIYIYIYVYKMYINILSNVVLGP